jgi:tRNA1Val (adenine37-N6)-methyltransferase
MSETIRAGETTDPILEGKLKVIQKEKGYRFSIDALLLAHFARLKKGDHVVDLGTGSGIIPMILAANGLCGRIAGLDIQEALIDMARRSLVINGLENHVEIIQGDVRQVESLFPAAAFHGVIFNPPYRRLHSGRKNPDDEKAIARHELRATLDDFLRAALYLLKTKGRVFVIYPAVRAVSLLSRMRSLHLEPKRVRWVHSDPASEGEFVLVEGLKEGKEALRVLPPLFIYRGEGGYTGAMKQIFMELSLFP